MGYIDATSKRNIKARLTKCTNQARALSRALQHVFDDLPLAGINSDEADKQLQDIITQTCITADNIAVFRNNIKED